MNRSHHRRRGNCSAIRTTAGPCRPRGGLHALLAFDICAFGDLARSHEDLLYLRATMYGFVEESFGLADLPWGLSHREDRGDGILLALPAGVPTVQAVDPLVDHLGALLADHNRRAAEPSRLRLRMSVDAGHVTHDGYGLVGRAANQLHRALDAPDFKAALAASSADLGVIVSSFVFGEVVSGRAGADRYRPVSVEVKETSTRAWACFPDGSFVPRLRAVPLDPAWEGA
ncbi:hypothetical protein LO762_15310 [Actinocorallia sp. API 0066]|uniref:hypothetical protein n=1 Tax=Actinocorallia sp. API 0066 TaxID=2896846 RepID=UPI001E5EAFB8|nr:hypothetical protein [Actinocorallia sp. API 0066]MCD0450548.1 hypothetical protein [Actinocorallia sp. API 0066]